MRVYLLLMLVAAAVTFLTTPFARWVALRTSAISAVRARDVHLVPTPRLGGLAMLIGILVAVLLASQMPFLSGVFDDSAVSQVWGIVGGAAIVCALGWADDKWDLDWVTKLAGQVLAAGFMALQGVQLITLPIGGLTIPSSRMSLVATVLVVVIAMNAVNFVDGLDGLAAGIVAIGGSAFFLYTYGLTQQATPEDYSSLASLMLAVLVGVCIGFLPHNFFPSRIFMGDAGSMLIGLVMAGAALGHSHRRAVVILYVWTAVFAFSAAALVQWNWRIVLVWTTVFVVLALLATLGPLRNRGRFIDDDVALSGQTPRVPAVVGAAASAGVRVEAGIPVQRVAPQSDPRPSVARQRIASQTKESIE